ncbi:MAG: UDP-N-acetylmuramoyl-L-alanine--D-glutamate ligase [Oscillospiraceae bacterium]|jgi:UDP-N-acetylmuramoylalanine--D-glutamate ligase|nr:UDP-N-acetylmuramoyl-L-alanine--D-glutamate ligase [Oscillospiraceae bacterium]
MNPAYQLFLEQFKGKEVAIIGFGVSNRPLARLLIGAGAKVTVCDKDETVNPEDCPGAAFRLGPSYLMNLPGEVIFRTPGLRPDHPSLEKARAEGRRVTSEMEEFFKLCPCPIIGVTGSDGKTTTTTLIAEMLGAAGITAHLGGNIGSPLLTRAGEMDAGDCAVVELSSFQLMDMTQSPKVAVITNITPNHLDWHRDMEEYIAAKLVLLRFQGGGDTAVLNADNPLTETLRGNGRTEYFGGFRIRDGMIDGFLPLSCIRLRGHYQTENLMAAMTAVRGMARPEVIRSVAENFGGVPHRNEFVKEIDGVSYYNNSIGSSPARTAATLRAHDGKVLLIAGGRDKNVPFDDLCALFPSHVKRLYLIGESAETIAAAALAVPGAPDAIRCADLEDAVLQAKRDAKPGDTVLLSPACTAFDAYKNFEERGKHFVEIVHKLR